MLSTELSGYSGANVEAENAESGGVEMVLMSFPSRIRTTAESGLEAIFALSWRRACIQTAHALKT